MKYLSITLIVSFITITVFLLAGCDSDTITQQDNSPPLNSQAVTADQEKAVTNLSDSISNNRHIVIFKDQPARMATAQGARQTVEKTDALFEAVGIAQDSLIHQYKWASSGFAAHLTTQQAEQLRTNPLVDHVAKDYYYKAINVASSVVTPTLSSLLASGSQTKPWGIDHVEGPLNGIGKTAWIIDTGIDLDHPDLNVDVVKSVSFVANESADDQYGHGTHVAGILAAKNNSRDVVGVAAGAMVVAVKVLDQNGGGWVSDVKAGVEYAGNNFSSGDVANMSLGYPVNKYNPYIDIPLADLESSIINAANSGLKFTLSAGNDSQDASNKSPGRLENNNVWTVSAYDISEGFASFSNYGNPPIEYGAPGKDVLSLWKNGGTNTISGTSMAAPHLAGLLLASGGDLDTDGVVSYDPDNDPDPIAVVEEPLQVTAGGPSIANSGDLVGFSSNATHEEGSISYQWYYRVTPTQGWTLDSGATSPNYTRTVYNPGGYKFQAVKVEVSSAGETASAVHDITVLACERSASSKQAITTNNPEPCN